MTEAINGGPAAPPPFAATLVGLAIGVPTVLGAFPVGLALVGMRFGPAAWLAVSWQLASAVVWLVIAALVLPLLRRRTGINTAAGEPPLTLAADGVSLVPVLIAAVAAHAATIAAASRVLNLGRGRPEFVPLFLDVLLLYAPMNVMTVLGVVAAAIIAAEHRTRVTTTAERQDLERQLTTARQQVVSALAEVNGSVAAPKIDPGEVLERLSVTIGTRTVVIPVDDIDLIEASSYYAQLHVGTHRYLIRQSMNSLEQRLDPKRFARIHRSTIVNLDRIVELRPHDRRSYLVLLRDGRRLMMSRRRRQLLDYLIP